MLAWSSFGEHPFFPSTPIPINLDKKELIKRTAFSRNHRTCPDDRPSACIRTSHRPPLDRVEPTCTWTIVLICTWTTVLRCTELYSGIEAVGQGLYVAIQPSRSSDTDMGGGEVHHTDGHEEAKPFVNLKNAYVSFGD